jgi:hypothetical protein
MSEHTLEYWERKFRLWRVLHPNITSFKNCGVCLLRNENCATMKGLVFNRNSKTISLSMEMCLDTDDCIEWIKYV